MGDEWVLKKRCFFWAWLLPEGLVDPPHEMKPRAENLKEFMSKNCQKSQINNMKDGLKEKSE